MVRCPSQVDVEGAEVRVFRTDGARDWMSKVSVTSLWDCQWLLGKAYACLGMERACFMRQRAYRTSFDFCCQAGLFAIELHKVAAVAHEGLVSPKAQTDVRPFFKASSSPHHHNYDMMRKNCCCACTQVVVHLWTLRLQIQLLLC